MPIDRPAPPLLVLAVCALLDSPALAQQEPAAAPPASHNIVSLFWQSADVFTGVIVLGSFLAVAIIFRSAIEIRTGNILPADSIDEMRKRINRSDWAGLRTFAEKDTSFAGHVVAAAFGSGQNGRDAARDAAELAASEQAARWFRRIELLNVVGHLGPLLGLVGTVYGMIIAFAALGATGGQAGPGELAVGISKALFHTFLGLMLAIPALFAYGWFRNVVDRICTRALVVSAELVDSIPDSAFRARD